MLSKLEIDKKKVMILGIIIIVAILVITFIVGCINKNKLNECKELYDEISIKTDAYLTNNNLYPTFQGQSITIDLNDIDPVEFKKKVVTGSVKYTKYNDTYIKTFYLDNCKCKQNFGKEKEKYDEKSINTDVVTYYNYYDASYYNSYWTKYIEPEKISSEQTLGVNLPTDSKLLPSIPNTAEVVEYAKEDKLYYSYRDILYKWYKNNVAYSGFSSEQPSGYTNKDTATQINSEPTDWNLNYPEEKTYRTITKKVGYRWYYEEKGKKIYWNDGAYYPTQPDEKYNKRSKESATMYSYTDKMWKWYNGTLKRNYSSYARTSGSYTYKDNDLYQYTSWSSYKDVSSLTEESKSYREEVSKTYSRYMIKYRVLSMPKLDKAVTREELEKIAGKTIEELMSDESLYVEVTFKFKY